VAREVNAGALAAGAGEGAAKTSAIENKTLEID
jgi:hypothetical protein